MEAAAPLNRPPILLEVLALFLIPPAWQETIGGDLQETYLSPRQYIHDAPHVLPALLIAQIRRNANIPVLAFQCVVLFSCFNACMFTGANRPVELYAIIPTMPVILLLLLFAAYRGEQPTHRRAILETITVAITVVFFSRSGAFFPAVYPPSLSMMFGIPFLVANKIGMTGRLTDFRLTGKSWG